MVASISDTLDLQVLPPSGRLAVEIDGRVTAYVTPGDRISLRPPPGAAHVVRLGHATFYERARRKLRLTDSAEIPAEALASDSRARPPRAEPGLPGTELPA